MSENFVKKVYTGSISLRSEFERGSYLALSDLSIRCVILERQLSNSVNSDLLSLILIGSNDFDDFKIKYNKYLKIKNNNSKLENFMKKDLNINIDLRLKDRVITKKNRRIGTIISNENEDDNLVTVKFNNNNNPVKISPYKLKKYNIANIN